MTVYLDNAATSWPKPPEVLRAAEAAITEPAGNPGRSAHEAALEAAAAVFDAREELGALFGAAPQRVIFTHNATHALNLAITGLAGHLKTKRTVLTDVWQHNSVLRPLFRLRDRGVVDLRFADPDRVENALDDSVGMGVFSAKSNVTGRMFDIKGISAALKSAGAYFVCDGSQAAGSETLNIGDLGITALCVPGHKGLMGLTGTGAMILSDSCPLFEPLLSGGTGNYSKSPLMPPEPPERYEAGTLNVVGIAALAQGVRFVSGVGVEAIGDRERSLGAYTAELLRLVPGVTVYSAENGIVLLNKSGVPSGDLEAALARSGVCARSGFHCAPLAHDALHTGEHGALRLSFGWFNSHTDVHAAVQAVASARGFAI